MPCRWAALPLCVLSLVAQERVRILHTPAPSGPDPVMAVAMERQEATRKGAQVPTQMVSIEGKILKVPVPPALALEAKAKHGQMLAETQASEALIREELSRLYQEQQTQIALLKAQPALAEEGQGSELHRRLWAQIKNPGLKAKEEDVKQGLKGLVEAYLKEGTLQKDVLDYFATVDQASLHSEGGGAISGGHGASPGAVITKFPVSPKAAKAAATFEGDSLLKGFHPLWMAYEPAMNSYLEQVGVILNDLEKQPQPPSTQLLARTLKIQMFERLSGFLALNAKVWTLAVARMTEAKPAMRASDTALTNIIPD